MEMTSSAPEICVVFGGGVGGGGIGVHRCIENFELQSLQIDYECPGA